MRIALFLMLLTGVIASWGIWKNLSRPPLGVVNGALLPCSSMPNCVGSDASDEGHFIPPLRGRPDALQRIAELLRSTPHIEIVEETPTYLRAEAVSKIFGFRDDLEFYFPAGSPVVHIRSSARVGYNDFGVNRARLEKIRTDYEASR